MSRPKKGLEKDRLKQLSKENKKLAQDLDEIENALLLQKESEGNIRSMLRKEIGGSVWQHGGVGKLHAYKSSKDINESEKVSLKETHKKKLPNTEEEARLKHNEEDSMETKGRGIKSSSKDYGIHKTHTFAPEVLRVGQDDVDKVNFDLDLASSGASSSSMRSRPSSATVVLKHQDPSLSQKPLDRKQLKIPVIDEEDLTSLQKSRADMCERFDSTYTVSPSHAREDSSGNKQLFDDGFDKDKNDERISEMKAKVMSKVMQKMESEGKLAHLREDSDSKLRKKPASKPNGKAREAGSAYSKHKSTRTKNIMKNQSGPVVDSEVNSWLRGLPLANPAKYGAMFAKHNLDIESIKALSEIGLRRLGIVDAGVLFTISEGIQKLNSRDLMLQENEHSEFLFNMIPNPAKLKSNADEGTEDVTTDTYPGTQPIIKGSLNQRKQIESLVPGKDKPQKKVPPTRHNSASGIKVNSKTTRKDSASDTAKNRKNVLSVQGTASNNKKTEITQKNGVKQTSSNVQKGTINLGKPRPLSATVSKPTSSVKPLKIRPQSSIIRTNSGKPPPRSALTHTGAGDAKGHGPKLVSQHNAKGRGKSMKQENRNWSASDNFKAARDKMAAKHQEREAVKIQQKVTFMEESLFSDLEDSGDDDDVEYLLEEKPPVKVHLTGPTLPTEISHNRKSSVPSIRQSIVVPDLQVTGQGNEVTGTAFKKASETVEPQHILHDIESQLVSIKENFDVDDDETVATIQRLQQQLLELQTKSQLKSNQSSVRTQSSNEQSGRSSELKSNQSSVRTESDRDESDRPLELKSNQSTVRTESSNPQSEISEDSKTLAGRSPENEIPEFSRGLLKNKPKMHTVSMSMSKRDLLKGMRKQQDEHRKEIRHLQGELNRIKHKDPLRHCEIVMEDIKYDENDLIGEGAFSQVFKGFFQGSDIAVKRLKIPLSAQDKNDFTAEVSLLRELRHPRIVLLMGVCTTSYLPLMVLEYMARGSLYLYLHDTNNPSLDHAAFYQIARDTALGMNYLHKHKPAVLHLDLKSMNVLLATHLRAKIADFGFSKLRHDANVKASQEGQSQGTKGTPAWMAPELLTADREISTKADVYSFGMILWEMVTRKLPYEGCSMFQVIERARTKKRPEIPTSCTKQLSSLIQNCWDPNPAVRPSFEKILQTLEELCFPEEWKTLFSVAGIPTAALNDLESTRTLIGIVTQTLELSGHDFMTTLEDSSDSSQDLSYENLSSPHEEVPSRPPKAPYKELELALDKLLLDTGDEGMATFTKSGAYGTKNKSQRSSQRSLAWSAKMDSLVDEPLLGKAPPPPPPPVPQLRLVDSDEERITKLKNQKPFTQGSYLDQLKAGVQLKPRKNGDKSKPKQSSGNPGHHQFIPPDALLAQKHKLRPTNQPHPNQLRDLSDVGQSQLNSIAEILKKAVKERRVALNEGNTLEEPFAETFWSED